MDRDAVKGGKLWGFRRPAIVVAVLLGKILLEPLWCHGIQIMGLKK
jgi:hypothetical protein